MYFGDAKNTKFSRSAAEKGQKKFPNVPELWTRKLLDYSSLTHKETTLAFEE